MQILAIQVRTLYVQGGLRTQGGAEFARNGLCNECISYSLLTDYFVFISSAGGSIWCAIPGYIM